MGGGSWNQGQVRVESQLHPAPQAGCLPGGRDTFPNSGRGPMWAGTGTASCSCIKNTRNGTQQTYRIRTSIFPPAGSYGQPSRLAGPMAHRRQGPKSFPSPCSANFDAGFVFGLGPRWRPWLQTSHWGDRVQTKKRPPLPGCSPGREKTLPGSPLADVLQFIGQSWVTCPLLNQSLWRDDWLRLILAGGKGG